MTAAPGLREALATAKAPCATDESLPRILASADNAAEDLGIALDVAARTNDPDRLPEIAVEAIVAAEGLEAAAKALETHGAALRRAAGTAADALRLALAADLAASGRKRVDASSHGAAMERGSLRVVILNGGANLPEAHVVITRKPNLSSLGKALAAGETFADAVLERGPPRVRITLLRETANQGT